MLLAFLGLWQILASTHVLSPLLFASPVSVVQRLGELLGGTNVQGHTIYADALATLQEMAIGYVIGAAVGLTLGFWFARSEWLARIFEPLILVSYTIPKIALAPVFILLLGIGLESKVAIVAMELFFLVFFNTFTGVKGVNEDYVRQARISGAPMRKIVRRIVFPAALPSIMLGLEMGIPFAMVGAVIGEFMAANKGLGWLVTYSASVFDPKDMFSGLIAIIAVVWVLSAALRLLKYKLLPWQADEGSQSRRPVTE